MRVLICPDSFKGCLDARHVANALRQGVLRCGAHEIDECPISDGGEGFTQAIAHARSAQLRTTTATASHSRPVEIPWCAFDRTGLFTVADIVGLALVPETDRPPHDPGTLTTQGIGSTLIALKDAGCERIVVGLGGSGTIDGGIGIAHALGFRFFDAHNKPLEPIGNNLERITRVEPPGEHPLQSTEVIAANDVTNPLTGPNGAARVFGPQKGATPEQIERLDAGLANLARVCAEKGLADGANHPGDGAAGGLGFGLRVFARATLTPGTQVVIEATGLRERISAADLVITGEGQLDSQSTSGKAAWAIGTLAHQLATPCVCIAGTLGDGWESAARAFTRVARATPEGMNPAEGIANAEKLIEDAVFGLPELADGR